MACPSEMYASPCVSINHKSNGSVSSKQQPPIQMGNLRLSRTVQRTYIGRRSGCSQPVIIALLVFSAFIFIFFQMANLIPRKPGFPRYPFINQPHGRMNSWVGCALTAPAQIRTEARGFVARCTDHYTTETHSHAPLTFAWPSNAVRDIAVYVKPDRHTTLLQPTKLCEDPPFVLIVVPSATNHSLERDTIRRTWGQWAGSDLSVILNNDRQVAQMTANKTTRKPPNVLTVHTLPPRSAKTVFLLGAVRGKDPISSSVMEESRLFGDIVVEDFIDSYTNLTLKTVFMLKWVQQHCPKAQYVMKVDDDIFLNVPNLQQSLLNKTVTTSPLLTGSLICGAQPIHNQWSKWYTPRYMFREGKYPNYLSGTGYVMSGDLVKNLFHAAITTPYFHLEDVFLTGICAKKIGIRPTDNIGFSYQPRAVNACVYKEVIMGHEVIPVQMVRLWNMMNQPKLVAKCHHMKKSQIRSYFPTKCNWR